MFPHTIINLHLYCLSLVYTEDKVFHNFMSHSITGIKYHSQFQKQTEREEKFLARVKLYYLLFEVKLVENKTGSSVPVLSLHRRVASDQSVLFSKGYIRNEAPLIL